MGKQDKKDDYQKKKKKEKQRKQYEKKKQQGRQDTQKLNGDQPQQPQNQQEPELEQEDQQEPEAMDLDADVLLTGRDYDNFRSIFENFNQHTERLMVKTYERYDPEKDQNQEQQEQQQQQQQNQDQMIQQQQQQQQYQNQMYMPGYIMPPKKEKKISKKERKQLRWLKVSQLKALVKRPDLVEFWDITSPDPLFLVHLKSQRNTVSIPRHWSQKRKYLQNKRGILKEPFKLPQYIESTGIAKLRDPFVDRDGGKMVRQKLRERMNPKQGKLDIDYEILHDAFFKYQVKPLLTGHGDIYFEGKEEEMRARTFRPGQMSASLRAACGITDYQAPPWLPNMQRYGPPPSYPNMKFIGMSSVFSEAATYHTSVKQMIEDTCRKYDKPGLYATFKYMDEDDYNQLSAMTGLKDDGNIDKGLWGTVEEVEEEREEDYIQENQQAQQQQQQQQAAEQEREVKAGTSAFPATKSGISSMISGFETPDIDLRKSKKLKC